jgi:predicted ABC-type ATPase
MSAESKKSNPCVYIIAGPNGAGKTTFARSFLPEIVHCNRFVNADLIAQGLSPFAPELVAIRAGRLMLEEINRLADEGIDFAFETTLSGKGYVPLLKRLKGKGYTVDLFYLWVPRVEDALARVAQRVREGGHFIPDADIRRRYSRGVYNLLNVYRRHLDYWIAFDNTQDGPPIIAYEAASQLRVVNSELFGKFEESSHAKE